ncbi:MAG: phasin family protein [Comamonadaceae bacterium]|nr:phasin family protein [Pseudomonadota bacterium]MDE2415080.1 phasin family protein [Comamonadaceae bacterium]
MPRTPRDENDDAPHPAHELPRMARESAQQIWLAGLGAFAKAQEEGGKVFEALVREGLALQRRTQSAAEEHLGEAAQRMGHLASGLGERAAGQWDRLEGIFEQRVAKALLRLGMPTAQDMQALQERVAALEAELQRLQTRQDGTTDAPAVKGRRKTGAMDED